MRSNNCIYIYTIIATTILINKYKKKNISSNAAYFFGVSQVQQNSF